jgi:hypothetical protein
MAARTEKTPKQAVNAYIRGVLSGKIPACEAIKQAVQRHVGDLTTARKRGFYFDEAAAERTIRFFRLPEALQGRVGEQRVRIVGLAAVHLVGGVRLEAAEGRAPAV